MKNLNLYLVTTALFLSCSKEKDMSLAIDNNLSDATHIGNLEIKKQKEQVFDKIEAFYKWFRANDGRIDRRYRILISYRLL